MVEGRKEGRNGKTEPDGLYIWNSEDNSSGCVGVGVGGGAGVGSATRWLMAVDSLGRGPCVGIIGRRDT